VRQLMLPMPAALPPSILLLLVYVTLRSFQNFTLTFFPFFFPSMASYSIHTTNV
jgi:hypothetical protein